METRKTEIEHLVRAIKMDVPTTVRPTPELGLLYEQPVDTIDVIRKLTLSKYDSTWVEVVGNIGSPAANSCLGQLVELLLDLNWPVYLAAENAILQFDANAFETVADDLVTDERFREFDALCDLISRKMPEMAERVRPFAMEAMKTINEYKTKSSISRLVENNLLTRPGNHCAN